MDPQRTLVFQPIQGVHGTKGNRAAVRGSVSDPTPLQPLWIEVLWALKVHHPDHEDPLHEIA